jgi:hypothetical protein
MGQRPEALFITSADSRIDPCLLTQIKPGELFICRVIGNVVPPYPDAPGGVPATIASVLPGAIGQRDGPIFGPEAPSQYRKARSRFVAGRIDVDRPVNYDTVRETTSNQVQEVPNKTDRPYALPNRTVSAAPLLM